MIRKNIRLRKEYLLHQQEQNKVKDKFDKKMKIKTAGAERKHLPTELYKEEEQLKKELAIQDDNNIIPRTIVDDEYALSVYRDPQIAITTCRNASHRIVQFMKELALVFPNTTRLNRGALVVKDLVQSCIQKNYSDLVIVHEHRGEPDGIIICHLPLGPTLYLGVMNAVMRHDLEIRPDPMSEAYPHLIFDGFSTALGDRVVHILKHLFPVPKPESKRVITFAHQSNIISFRHHTYDKPSHNQAELHEIGPRFDLKPYQIVLGTLGQKEAPKEWALRQFINTAGKKNNF